VNKPGTAQRKIIEHVHYTFATHDRPFSVWEVSDSTLIDRSTVRRLFIKLRELGFLGRTKRAYAGRFWEATAKWPEDVNDIIMKYEIYQSMKMEIE